MSKYYCKYCGKEASSIRTLTSFSCQKNPHGRNHEPYEGTEANHYFCKYCGKEASSIRTLTSFSCRKNPHSQNHEPAL